MLDPVTRAGMELVTPFTGFVQPDGTERRGYAAFAFASDDTRLAQAFNEGLARITRDGTLLDVLKRYGFDEGDLPGDATAEALCRG